MIQEAAVDLCLAISLLTEVFKWIYLLSYVRNTYVSFLLTKILLKAYKKSGLDNDLPVFKGKF